MKGATETTLRADVIYDSRQPTLRPFSTSVRVRYFTTTPLAVVVEFPDGERWPFARDLLLDGVDKPVGIADVHVEPWTGPDKWLTAVTFTSPDGTQTFLLPTAALRRFLAETEKLVPHGSEVAEADVDGLIAACLRERAS